LADRYRVTVDNRRNFVEWDREYVVQHEGDPLGRGQLP